MQTKIYCYWTKPVLLVLMTMTLVSCDLVHSAPQFDWQPHIARVAGIVG